MKIAVVGNELAYLRLSSGLRRALLGLQTDSVFVTENTKEKPDVVISVAGLPAKSAALSGVPEIWVALLRSEIVVTPPHDSKTAGCPLCVYRSLVRNKSRLIEGHLLLPQLRTCWPSSTSLEITSTILARKLTHFSIGNDDYVDIISIPDLLIEYATLIPDPGCPRCGDLQADEPQGFTLRTRVKSCEGKYRWKEDFPSREFLTQVQDRHIGLVTDTYLMPNMPVAFYSAFMPIGNGRFEIGIGRADLYEESRAIAILEILERYAGYAPRGKATSICARYCDLVEHAVHPARFGFHEPAYYANTNSPVTPFCPETEYSWVWAFSFLEKRPVLVPEQLVYFGIQYKQENRFSVEISNGCAIGGCLEEAIFHGLLEVIERDLFLLAWYSQAQLPEIDRSTIKRRETIQLIERVETLTRSTIRLFDATFDVGVPVVWALAEGINPTTGIGSAAGIHIDPEGAICSALRELGPALVASAKRMENEQQYAHFLAANFDEVKTMSDHTLLYRVPEMASYIDFLKGPSRQRRIGEMVPAGFSHRDLKDDLNELVQRVLSCSLDVVFIDQTPTNFPKGLRVAKVLVPGMLPMTFGHAARRLSGLSRVHEVPSRLGLSSSKTCSSNLAPHPFP